MAKKEKKARKKYTSIGGQALMEGIMMRGPHKAVMCVRRMDGSITTEEVAIKKPTIWNKIPIIRGLVGFVQSMSLGTKMLMRSADYVIEDEEKAAAAEEAALAVGESAGDNAAEAVSEAAETVSEAVTGVDDAVVDNIITENTDERNPAAEADKATEEVSRKLDEVSTSVQAAAAEMKTAEKLVKARKEKKEKKSKDKKDSDGGFLTLIATVLGFGLAVVLFFFMPTWAYTGLLMILPEEQAAVMRESTVWKSVIEGLLKLIIFLVYMLLISGMKEIKRLFQYHGAEHKAIFCYEAGEELTVENVRKYKRFHPRCGTSFLILMLLVGIAAGIVISALLPEQYDNSPWIRPLIKLAFIPAIMGVGYELLKFAGKHDNILTRIISAPGLWMQRISTREPDDKQIECAIAALKPVIPEDGEDMK